MSERRVYAPTSRRCRWVVRPVPSYNSSGIDMGWCARVLQQEIEVEVYVNGELHHTELEWQDVPEVEE